LTTADKRVSSHSTASSALMTKPAASTASSSFAAASVSVSRQQASQSSPRATSSVAGSVTGTGSMSSVSGSVVVPALAISKRTRVPRCSLGSLEPPPLSGRKSSGQGQRK
jgi:hypothetical protein